MSVNSLGAITGIGAGWLAASMAAAGAVVALHLLAKNRSRAVIFPAARFALPITASMRRRKRPHDLLLIVLRAGIAGALGLAFALPMWRGAALNEAPAGDFVLVIDESASMRHVENGMTLFDAAVERAKTIIGAMDPARSRANIVWLGARPNPALGTMTSSRTTLLGALEGREPTYERGDAPAALAEAVALLGRASRAGPGRVIILSDMQRTQWEGVLEEYSAAPRVDVRTIGTETARENLALDGLEVTPARPSAGALVTMSARVRNLTPEPRSIAVRFMMDGSQAGEAFVDVEPWGERRVQATSRYDQEGWFGVEARLDDDSFDADDAARAGVQVARVGATAIVTSTPAETWTGSPAWLFAAALHASAGAAPTVLAPEALEAQGLRALDTVTVVGTESMNIDAIEALRAYALAGGLIVWHVSSPESASALDALLKSARSGACAWTGGDQPPSPLLVGPAARTLEGEARELIELWEGEPVRQCGLIDLPSGVLLTAEAGAALARLPMGGGAIVIVAFECAPGRLDAARTPLFPALVHGLREVSLAESAGGWTVLVGERLDRRYEPARTMGSARLSLVEAREPGMVRIEREDGSPAGVVGVDIDPRESDLRALELALGEPQTADAHEASTAARASLELRETPIWHLFVGLTAALLVVEGWIRTRARAHGPPNVRREGSA